MTLECLLEQEVREMVGARRYERLGSRKDHLNGTYLRRLLTSMGLVEIAVPRTRYSGAPAAVVGRYKRRTDEVDRLVTTAYVQGVSTRDMTRVSQALMGEGISRSTVSRVTKVLGEQVEQLRRAPIEGPIPYLYLDATLLDARWARSVENVSALVAYGVDGTGHRRLLAMTLGAEESEQSWAELLTQVCERGLSGVQLVIADDHRGLANAVRRHLPEAPRQRCTVHLESNVLTRHLSVCVGGSPSSCARSSIPQTPPRRASGYTSSPRASAVRSPRPCAASRTASPPPPSSTRFPVNTGCAYARPMASRASAPSPTVTAHCGSSPPSLSRRPSAPVSTLARPTTTYPAVTPIPVKRPSTAGSAPETSSGSSRRPPTRSLTASGCSAS